MHDSTNTRSYTCPGDGKIMVFTAVCCNKQASSNPTARSAVTVNGATIVSAQASGTMESAETGYSQNVSSWVDVNEGDIVSITLTTTYTPRYYSGGFIIFISY